MDEVYNTIDEVPVTPCTGVWIEISLKNAINRSPLSLPARECGLKSKEESKGYNEA